MSSPNKKKGTRFELELVKDAQGYGLEAKRAWGSDGRSMGEHEEVDLLVEGFKVQAKRMKALPKYLGLTEHVDVAVFREDRGESFAMMRWADWLAYLKPKPKPKPKRRDSMCDSTCSMHPSNQPVDYGFSSHGNQIDRNFFYHPPKPGQPEQHANVRRQAKYLAELMDKLCPPGREKSLALAKLEESVMWANAAIARGAQRE